SLLLFANFYVYDPHFWGLINITLYLFHQTEEQYVPGGFKDFMNRTVMALPQGQEKLIYIKIFWINILMVWLAFAVFGALSFINLGFGL
ncbi:HXXEE domain-containing protein, partial [Francisella tularensis subsp. holarctica]|nr:HXXEE domain-containing protein [Francisella tularensis subsp. holarctica]